MASSFLSRSSFTSTLVILLTIATIAFMSSAIVTVNAAPSALGSSESTVHSSESNLDASSPDHKQPLESGSPSTGVFVSPHSARDGRSNVRVGLPFIFGMDLNRNRDRSAGNQTRLDLGVLGGLVRVSMDRFRGVNGSKSGPVEVSIFGIPVTSG